MLAVVRHSARLVLVTRWQYEGMRRNRVIEYDRGCIEGINSRQPSRPMQMLGKLARSSNGGGDCKARGGQFGVAVRQVLARLDQEQCGCRLGGDFNKHLGTI